VWKFYLQKLLNEGNESTGNKAFLTLTIKNNQVIEFWDELKLKFMPSQKKDERRLILKVLILLYKN
jgi:hypothetical protein